VRLLSLARLLLHDVVVRDGRCAQLLCGGLYVYQISCYNLATMRFTTQMMLRQAWIALHLAPRFFVFFPFLATQENDVKTYSCRSPLCRFTSPTPTPSYPPLCMALCRLSLLRYYLDTSIQQDVSRQLILGYNRLFLYLCSFSPFTLLHLQCHVHFAN